MVIYNFNRNGENMGTRTLGERVRGELIEMIKQNDKVVLNFEGVNVVSNSFADECLAKLILFFPFEVIKKKTTFRGLNDFARKNIAVAFRRRLDSQKSEVV